MKTKKYLLFAFVLVMVSSCYAPKYLPNTNKIDIGVLGSFIKITQNSHNIYAGELIEVNNQQIIILDNVSKEPIAIDKKDVKKFQLFYAQPKNYGAYIPLFILNPLMHGKFAIFTIPFHLLITIPVTVSGANDFTYTNKNLTYEELKMFARFPQGLPENFFQIKKPSQW